MTEREKMLQGLPYCPGDEELRSISNYGKELIKKYNNIPAEENENRSKVLAELFGHCGKNVRVNQPFYVDYGNNIYVGDDVVINLNCTFLDTNKIVIGSRVLIGPDVKIYTATHPINSNERFQKKANKDTYVVTMAKPVEIGDDVWIGGGSIILPGISIGNNCTIGAGSVVTKSIPDNSVAYGNPCRVIRKSL